MHSDGGETEPVAGHPQFNLKQLLDLLKTDRDNVTNLSLPSRGLELREKLVSEALRPAESTNLWACNLSRFTEEDRASAFEGVTIAEADGEQEEARIAALALREVLEDPGKKAALVTPDRALARRVMLELKRWNIEVEDTAGMPLGETPPALLMRLMVEAVVSQFDPVRLLALLKHPLASFGMARTDVRRAARFIELEILRGPRLGSGLSPLQKEFSARKRREQDRLGDGIELSEIWEIAENLMERLQRSLEPLLAIANPSEDASPAFATWLSALIQSLEAVASDGEGSPDRLYDEEAGRSFRSFLDRTGGIDSQSLTLNRHDLAPFLVAMMSGETVLKHGGGSERLQLLGTLEARLLDADRVVIGGLNESSWPADIKSDAWLSRPMRAGMRLEPPERRIGLAAHDFAQSLGRKEVVLLRARKMAGEPTVPSRWQQRLEAIAGTEQQKAMRERGRQYEDWAKLLDAPKKQTNLPRPAPMPPTELRPRRLSVTEIETWIRDPYALYAKHVLGLHPIDAIGLPPGGADRGSIIHEALAKFTKGWHGAFDESALEKLLEIGREEFQQLENFPEVLAFWWPRFERIARWFIFDWEANRQDRVAGRHAEIKGSIKLPMAGGDFSLRGRADRLDMMHGDGLSIIDFKTGAPPSARQVLPGFAPQLALEGYMAKLGGFDDIPRGVEVTDMEWIQLSGGRDPGVVKSGVEKDYAAEDIVELIGKRLLALITAYDDPNKGYQSRARPMFERFESPYDHLARVKEWSLHSEESE